MQIIEVQVQDDFLKRLARTKPFVALAGTTGIQVWAYSEGPTCDAAKALVAALDGNAIAAKLLPDKPQDPTNKKIEIIVGSKF